MAPMANKDEIRYQKPPCRMLPKEKSPPLREGGTGWPLKEAKSFTAGSSGR